LRYKGRPISAECQSNLAKRLGNLAIAGALIGCTLPLMAIVALAIKLESRGSAFVRQELILPRSGRFMAVKFRTTAHDSETGQDGRVTRLGWFLRYTRIENLPQLINVVRGEMSVISPSPERPRFLDYPSAY
jgi:lipopolysaccharide/colanic/teichoic acid biosynthesis glycosyltransferase